MSPLYAASPSRLGESRFLGTAERPLDRGAEELCKKSARSHNLGRSPLLSHSDGSWILCGSVTARQEDASWVQMDRLVKSQDCLRRMSTGPLNFSLATLPRHSKIVIKPRAGPLLNEGPSCIFVGPLESAEPSRLEDLYQQARDSYYSGRPLIVDEMFDRVEKRLRWHGSKVVLKYPRCSLRGFSAYADAEFDRSQVLALSGVWSALLASGVAIASAPPMCMYNKICQSAVHVHFAHGGLSAGSWLTAIAMGLMAGIPVSIAAVNGLRSIWRGDVMALKGCCPNCGEEVYAFIQSHEAKPRLKTECHVCEHPLVFHVNIERVDSQTGQPWAYGRVYLVTRSKDLVPPE